MPSNRRYRTGEPKGRLSFTAESVTHRLIESIAPRFQDQPGGYTRLVRLPKRRLGDCSPLAALQLIGAEEAPVSLTKPRKSARRRRADARYAMAGRAAKAWADKGLAAAADQTAPQPEQHKDDAPEPDSGGSGDAADNEASTG
jgi:large subunit ribosomal protein L17